jgi:hypothetical protein
VTTPETRPYTPSPEAVAVHLVEVANGKGRSVVGMTVTKLDTEVRWL